MRTSLILSAVLHLLLIGAALVNFTAGETLPTTRPVTVEIVTPSELSELKAGKPEDITEAAAPATAPPDQPADIVPTSAELRPADKVSQTQAALPPPKPKASPPAELDAAAEITPAAAAAAKPAPAEKVEAKPEPKPSLVPPPVKRGEPPKPRAETVKRPEPDRSKRAEEKPSRRASSDQIADLIDRPTPPTEGESAFDPKQIAALLNRDPTAGSLPPQDGPREPWRQPSSLQEQALGADRDAPRQDTYGAREGRDARMSVSDIDAFRAQISRCWTPPVGGLGGDAIIVKLRIALNQDGTLNGPPQVANSYNSPFFRPAADSAMRAVFQCQPYRMPPEKYGQWRDMLLNFDPSRMYGG